MKIMVVGDEVSGKTDMLVHFCRGDIDNYSPSQFDSYNVPMTVDGVFIFLSIWDTSESSKSAVFRQLAYPGTHVFLICFSLYHEDSFNHVRSKWYPEVHKHAPNVPIILVGTDNINPAKANGTKVSQEDVEKLAKDIGAYKYTQLTTATTPDAIFSEAVRCAFATYSENKSGESSEQCVIS